MLPGPEDHPNAVFSGPFIAARDEEHFLAQVGACLLEWGHVDNILFSICVILLETDASLALIVYGRTPTLESRLILIEELVRCHFPTIPGLRTPIVAFNLKSISQKIRKLQTFRNAIAHGSIQSSGIIYMDGATGRAMNVPNAPSRFFFVYPSATNKNAGEQIHFKDLQIHQREVFQLSLDLRDFRSELEIVLPQGSSLRMPPQNTDLEEALADPPPSEPQPPPESSPA